MKKLLPYLERVFLTGLIIGFVFSLTGIEIPYLLTISLGGLGITFFLNAYLPVGIESTEKDKMGFNELLGLLIVPKVLWISSAIATLGILFYTLKLDNNGYMQMLYIGGSTIITPLVIMLILKAIGTKYIKFTNPAIFRAVPILFVIGYILFG